MRAVEGWGKCKVRDICELGRGRVISGQEIERNPGVFPVYSSQSINNGKMGAIDTFDFDGEYVTWTTDGAYAGTVFYRSGQFNCTNVCGTLRAKAPQVCMSFLAYKLSTLAKDYVSYVGNPKLMNGVMAGIEISIPTSKSEQSKIAEILSTVDRAIEQTESLITKQQRIKTGLMQDLLTRGIDEHGNLRSEQTHQFKDSPLGKIPVEWALKRIGDVFEIQLGKMLSQKAIEGRFPFYYLGNKNVQWDYVDTSGLQQMDFCERERCKYELNLGDILVCEGGEVGRTAIWRGEVESCYYQKAVHRLRPIDHQFLPGLFPRFMKWCINNGLLSDYTSQTSIAHLTQEKLAAAPIMVPAFPEQKEINDIFDQFDIELGNQTAKLNKIRVLKIALMQDMLTGKKRVTELLKTSITN